MSSVQEFHQGAWLYADPYAYQYSDLLGEESAVSPNRPVSVAGSISSGSGKSSPTNEFCFELPADPVLQVSHHQIASETSNSCGLSRSRLSNGRGSRRYASRCGNARDEPVSAAPAAYTRSAQPPCSGLIPVAEDCPLIPIPEESYLIPVPEESYLIPVTEESYLIPVPEESGLIPVEHYARNPSATRPYYQRSSRPACDDGLMLVNEDTSSPKTPNSDFDAILRNIEPVSKSGKGKVWRARSGRYYDRYSSNFG